MNSRLQVAVVASLAVLGACAGDQSDPPSPPDPLVSWENSTVTASADSLAADGASVATITVTLKDPAGELITQSAGVVSMHATSGSLGGVRDNADGTYTAVLTAPLVLGLDTISTRLDGTPLGDTLSIPFVPGPPAQGHWVRGSQWLYADGVSQTQVTVDVQDAHGHAVTDPGAVTIQTTAGSLSHRASGGGSYWAVLTSTTRDETASVTAVGRGVTLGSTLSVRFETRRHWSVRAPLPAARMSMGVTEANGLVYAVGGKTADPDSWVNTLAEYDPGADAWTAKAPMPTARTDLAAGAVGGMVYAVGGANANDLHTVEAYNPATDTWSSKAPMPTARSGLAVGVVNGILYAVGGRRRPGASAGVIRHTSVVSRPGGGAPPVAWDIVPSSGAIGAVEAYNPSSDSWTKLPSLPTPRAHMGVGVVDGILYAVGGSSGTAFLSTVEAFNPATGTWTRKAPMPTARALLAVAVLDGKLYAIGGLYDYFFGLTAVEVYDPATDSWTTTAYMLVGRLEFGAAVVNGLLYAVGGGCDYEDLDSVEAFTP